VPLSDLPADFLPPAGEPGFLDENGSEFLNWNMIGSWRQSSLNRGIFATRGMSNDLSLEFSVPAISDLEFFKLRYNFDSYFPITNSLTLRLRAALGYGDGFGKTSELPFYEHFFAGGFGSVRGFRINSLGSLATQPQVFRIEQPVTAIDENGNPTEIGGPTGRQFGYVATDSGLLVDAVPEFRRPQPFGGNTLIEGSAEIIFPLPFVKDQYSFRPTIFFDWGNVFDTRCSSQTRNCFDVDLGEMRYSVGIGLTWLSGFGPISLAIAKPMNAGPFDRKEVFQFSLGRGL
jgi:outer membrane protein insertion porin family